MVPTLCDDHTVPALTTGQEAEFVAALSLEMPVH
jgi:hypothetical protein